MYLVIRYFLQYLTLLCPKVTNKKNPFYLIIQGVHRAFSLPASVHVQKLGTLKFADILFRKL